MTRIGAKSFTSRKWKHVICIDGGLQRTQESVSRERVSCMLLPSLILALFRENFPSSVYGQATQDGCSLALRTPPARPVPASPTPFAHD